MLPRPPRGTPKGFIFLWFFKSFAFLGLLGAILAQHGLLAAPKSLQDTSKSFQYAAKTLPRHTKKLDFSRMFSMVSNPWDFLALSWLNVAS